MIMLWKVHAAPTNAGGLFGYLLYSGHLKYPQNTKTNNNYHCIVFIGIIILAPRWIYTAKPLNQDT